MIFTLGWEIEKIFDSELTGKDGQRKMIIDSDGTKLLDKITETIIAYLQQKIKSGVDLVQLFDSWAGILTPSDLSGTPPASRSGDILLQGKLGS